MGNFNKVVIKNLKKHTKGAWLTALGTKEGLCFLPFVNKDKNIMFKTPPVKVEDCFDGVVYQIEDYGNIAKMADVIDFEKDVKTAIKDGRQYLCVGQAEYAMKEVQWYDESESKLLSTEEYKDHSYLDSLDSKHVKAVSVCASDDLDRYYMRGVCITPEDMAVATDGNRMAWAQVRGGLGRYETNFQAGQTGTPDERKGFMIPKELTMFMSDEGNTFYWTMHEKTRKTAEGNDERYLQSHVRFLMKTEEGYEFYYQPIEGRFPNYRKVIPDYYDKDEKEISIDFSVLRYKKQGLPRLCFEGTWDKDKCWQNYNGLRLDFSIDLKLGENYRLVVNAGYIAELAKTFGKKFEGKLKWRRDDVEGSEATGYDIVKQICFTTKEELETDPKVIIMPLNPKS